VQLRTERLLLRPFETGDVDAVWAYQRLPEVSRHMLRPAFDRDESAAFVHVVMTETAITAAGDTLTFAVVLADGGTLIGEVSLHVYSLLHRGGELGYAFHPGYQGQGYATEAAEALLRHGFGDLGLHRVIAACSARNTASARLMERLGMRREAHLIGCRLLNGVWRDEFVYAILADEWRARLTSSP
jgi:RimJ/RimL family protein N-acetyltransferase